MKYEFSLILNASDLTDSDAEKLYECGCDDSSILTRAGVSLVQFDREAATLEVALASAIRDVEKAGFRVARVEIERDEAPQLA